MKTAIKAEYFKCGFCIHIESNDFKCSAFPEGIPEKILTGEFDHSKKYPGQGNEIVFEAVEGVDSVDVVD